MNTKVAKELIEKYQAGTATADEIALIEKWVMLGTVQAPDLSDEELAEDFLTIRSQLPLKYERKRVQLWPRIIGVAAAVAAVTLGIWLYYASNLNGRHPDSALSSRANAKDLNDIAPGKNTATIKIGDGEAITLSDKQTGVVVNTNQVTYNDGSTVLSSRATPLSSRASSLSSRANAKDPSGLGMTKEHKMTITTPRGGTYQITLPDGTKVWLNAASVLTYTMPLKERGGVRKVELSGEAYFEVFRNKKQPFVVTTKNLTTTVLGTHFNISAYGDDKNTKATLLEGSIKVASLQSLAPLGRGAEGGEGNVILKPSQQATITGNNAIQVKTVPPEETIDWKNGTFVFNGEALENIMRKVARWYNIEVTYETNAPKDFTLSGVVSRTRNISAVLERMESTGKVKFKIEGRKVTVGR